MKTIVEQTRGIAFDGCVREVNDENNSEALKRLVFVGGSPRSGTTLVQRILNCHPAVYGGPEFDFVPEIADLFKRMRQSIHRGRIDCILNESMLARTFRSLISSLLIPKADDEGAEFLSEKTPGNVLAFEVLESLAPESKKIFVLRDPRDVVSSMLEVGERQRRREGHAAGFVGDIVSAVNYMNSCLSAGIATAERSKNCRVVYYEHLVLNPLEEANRLYDFIGVERLQQLDLKANEFDTARDLASWRDWVKPDQMEGQILKSRVGTSLFTLSPSDLNYITAKVVKHRLVTERYQLDDAVNRAGVFWCVSKTAAKRVKRRLSRLPKRVTRTLFS